MPGGRLEHGARLVPHVPETFRIFWKQEVTPGASRTRHRRNSACLATPGHSGIPRCEPSDGVRSTRHRRRAMPRSRGSSQPSALGCSGNCSGAECSLKRKPRRPRSLRRGIPRARRHYECGGPASECPRAARWRCRSGACPARRGGSLLRIGLARLSPRCQVEPTSHTGCEAAEDPSIDEAAGYGSFRLLTAARRPAAPQLRAPAGVPGSAGVPILTGSTQLRDDRAAGAVSVGDPRARRSMARRSPRGLRGEHRGFLLRAD